VISPVLADAALAGASERAINVTPSVSDIAHTATFRATALRFASMLRRPFNSERHDLHPYRLYNHGSARPRVALFTHAGRCTAHPARTLVTPNG
jgi:hypothetical protein